jgi:CheY-like chemotaxis protein
LEAATKSADISAVLKHAMDGWEARRYLRGEGDFADRSLYAVPDLILCDLKMPRMNGFELLMWLRGQSALRRIPFIMMDSRADQGEVDRAFEQGANSFVVKPKELHAYSRMLELIQRYWLDLNLLPKVA